LSLPYAQNPLSQQRQLRLSIGVYGKDLGPILRPFTLLGLFLRDADVFAFDSGDLGGLSLLLYLAAQLWQQNFTLLCSVWH
jgi:hypothetical protein